MLVFQFKLNFSGTTTLSLSFSAVYALSLGLQYNVWVIGVQRVFGARGCKYFFIFCEDLRGEWSGEMRSNIKFLMSDASRVSSL